MKRSLYHLLFVATWLTIAAGAQAQVPASFADIAERLVPSVVNISTSQVVSRPQVDMPQFPPGSPFEFFFRDLNQQQARPRRATSLGSGFIIDSSGIIVTNNHVVEGAQEITIILHDETRLKGEVIGRDPKTDIALLRVKPTKPLVAAKIGDSDAARVGDWVLAIGNPYGLGGSVTAGIISARARDINAGPYDDFIQTDAPINRGNSGGPLFNMKGEVIGMNTAIFSPTGGSIGIGFAVPMALAEPVIKQIKDFGRTKRGWLGVRIQDVTPEIAESLGMAKAQGALIAAITPDGPAAAAGMQATDVIIRFNGQVVDDVRKLPRLVAAAPIGQKVDVVVWRQGREVTLRVAAGELEKAEADGKAVQTPSSTASAAAPTLGMELATLTPELRTQLRLSDSVRGVVVTKLDPAGQAAEKGIEVGDIISEVGQEPVRTGEEVIAKVRAADKAGRKSVLFKFLRDGEALFVAFTIN